MAEENSTVAVARFWRDEIKSAQESMKPWTERGQKVIDRYRDERTGAHRTQRKFNILWSNVQVLKPALYGRMPKPEVARRYQDQDPVGRVASMMLERCLEYEVEQYPDFNTAMSGVVEDRLLPGRGIAWIRYEPKIETEPQVSEDVNAQAVNAERLAYECAPCDYVNWKDFLHNPARTWDEVWWVARRVWMTREEGERRFGVVFQNVPLEKKSDNKNPEKETPKDALKDKGEVWEIWDKTEKVVTWVCLKYADLLDQKPDPLGLEDFLPCPKPLYATLTTGSLEPIPDYCQYQDQAEELDHITNRISKVLSGIKVAGVYNSAHKAIKRLLNEGFDNDLIPVDDWASFAEKNGLDGAIQMLDNEGSVKALEQLYLARESVLSTIYQTMGLSDIMRGATKAQETLGAQQLKANFGSMRLRSPQEDVARFATDLLKLKGEIVGGHFSPETIITVSGIEQTPDGQNPELVQAAVKLIKSGQMRGFRISIESDTLAQIDEAQQKADAVEYVTAMGTILEKSGPIVQSAPTMLPFISEIMLFAARSMKAGRTLESALEKSIQATQQALMQQASQPNPEVMKAKVEEESAVRESARRDKEVDADIARKDRAAAADVDRSRAESQAKRAIADADASSKRDLDKEKQRIDEDLGRLKIESDERVKLGTDKQDKDKQLAENDQKLSAQANLKEINGKLDLLVKVLSTPRKKSVKRDKQGRIEEIEER